MCNYRPCTQMHLIENDTIIHKNVASIIYCIGVHYLLYSLYCKQKVD